MRHQLEAARLSGVTQVALETLLPAWARGRVGTFPDAGEEWTNCFWTSLRFLDRAHGPVGTGEAMDARLRGDFVLVARNPRFGDVIVLRDAAGRALHSATW